MLQQHTSINKKNIYEVVMYMQWSHSFFNIHTPDDGPRSGKKYQGTN